MRYKHSHDTETTKIIIHQRLSLQMQQLKKVLEKGTANVIISSISSGYTGSEKRASSAEVPGN